MDVLSPSAAPHPPRPRALDTVLYGGLTVGVLDALDAVSFFGLWRGVGPQRIFQHVASSLLGRGAFAGGWPVTAFGLGLHFLVATGVAVAYHVACLAWPRLAGRGAPGWGLLYGVAVFFAMECVVVPLTAVRQGAWSPPVLLNGILGHALLVGLPVALWARWSAIRRRA